MRIGTRDRAVPAVQEYREREANPGRSIPTEH